MGKIKVLIIEDDIRISKNLELVIENLGYEVSCIATTAEDAFEFAYEKTIDLVISDIEIRGLTDGIETAKNLQNTYNLPIIFTSAYNDQDKLNRASQLKNMVGYLVKPIRLDELDTLIKIAILKFQIEEKKRLKEINNYYKYDFDNKVLFEDDKEVELTKNESLLLSLLLNVPGETLSYDDIKNSIWKDNSASDVSRRQLVHRLKTKLNKLEIVSEKGIGIYIKE